MRKVNYPADMSKLLAGYLKLFPVNDMQKIWPDENYMYFIF